MTRSNLYITLSNGEQIIVVADSSTAPEQGFIVETLILPLLSCNNAEQELYLLGLYCSFNDQRINADYRYEIDLPKKKVGFYEERYFYKTDVFRRGKDLTDRYIAYLETESELEQANKPQFADLSNARLIARANSLPDFKWDDEGVELQRRRRVSNGRFDYEMQGNSLVITRDQTI